ncbi:MAG: hypothetical protein ACE5H3_03560 [Planctomycetota bacterium]
MRLTAALFLVLGGPLLGAPIQDDTIFLKDGRILDGLEIQRAEGGVRITYPHGEVFVPESHYLEVAISGDTSFVPRTEAEKTKAAKGLVPFHGKWMSPEKRSKLVAKEVEKRHKAIEDLAAHKLWRNRYQEDTSHFHFEYTVPPRIYDYYRDLMEAYFKAFAKDWKVKQPRELGRLHVCFYDDADSFHQVSGAGFYVLGYFRFIPPMELDIYYDPNDPKSTEDTLFHEANHYLQKLVNVDFAYPHWPGEALAEYYGASNFDPKTGKLTTGLVQEGRLTEIQTDIASGNMLGLEELISSDGIYQHYTWGWSLVHFLMHSKAYSKKFQKFFLALAHAKDVKREAMGFKALKTVTSEEVFRAFRKYLGLRRDKDVRKMEAQWHDYVKNKLGVATVRGLEEAGLNALRTSPPRPIRAKRILQEAIDKGSENPQVYYRMGRLLQDDKKFEVAIGNFRKAVTFAPLNPRYYLALGDELLEDGDEQEGARMVRLAQEIDPEAFELSDRLKALLKKADKDAAGEGEEAGAKEAGAKEDSGKD